MGKSIPLVFLVLSACNPANGASLEKEAPFFSDFRARMARIDADVSGVKGGSPEVSCRTVQALSAEVRVAIRVYDAAAATLA